MAMSYLETHPVRGERLHYNLRDEAAQLRLDMGEAERRGVALVKQGGLTLVLTVLKEGAHIGAPEVHGASSVQVLDGRLAVRSPGGELELLPGDLAAFRPHVEQELVALQDAAVLITVAAEGIVKARGSSARGRGRGGG